jgi:hypothetical protein
MAYDLIDGVTIAVSIFAVGFSVGTFIITYRKGKKTEQMKVAMEISAKLEEAQNKVLEIEEQQDKSSQNPDNSMLEDNHEDAYLVYMNHWEFYSFLVNNREIDNKSIKKYFESNLKSATDRFFKRYPKYITNKKSYEEIKKLLKEIGHEPEIINKN